MKHELCIIDGCQNPADPRSAFVLCPRHERETDELAKQSKYRARE